MELKLNNKKLYSLLERIIFNKDEFTKLKKTITKVNKGQISPKNLREQIIQYRVRILEDLLEFFPFYVKHSKEQLNKGQSKHSIIHKEQDFIQKLHERDELLELIATRLNGMLPSSPEQDIIEDNICDKNRYFVIDGANVARDNNSDGNVHNLNLLIEKLHSYGIDTYRVICDRSLFYTIDYQEKYSSLLQDEHFIEITGGVKADPFILQLAKDKDAYIISNNMFQEYYDQFDKEWIKQKRMTFKIIDNTIYFDNLDLNN